MVSDITNNVKNNEDGHESLVYGHKLSSVGPAKVTGNNTVYEPSNIDLALKLHYLRLVYFLDSRAVEGITLRKIKECIFSWLCYYYESCGRFRRSESGRPYIKCNDCGVRFLEAKSPKSIDDWLKMENTSAQRLLVPDHHVLGPELTFSPPVFMQITYFECGGISLGLSWAHVLGDAISASNFMNTLSQFLRGQGPTKPPCLKKWPPNFQKPAKTISSATQSVKDLGPLGDHWIIATPCEMETFTFHVISTQLAQLQVTLSGSDQTSSPIPPFEVLCAIIWRAIAKIRAGPEPNTVIVVKKDATGPIEDDMTLRNSQVIGYVKADFSVKEAHLKELAVLIRDWAEDERAQIGDMVDRDPGGSNFAIYGSKLTFVNLEEAAFYGFELQGLSPRFVNCFVDGIGEEGAVLVLPGPYNMKCSREGRVVTLILPKSYMVELKEELKKEHVLIA